jgi:DNA-binding response OmpR family regulator
MLLGIWGHEAHIAYNGQQAIELSGTLRPEIVLLDIGLPGLSGYDTCRRMCEEAWGQDMTVVAVTGWGNEIDRSRSSDAGFDHHLVKPVDFAALSAVLAANRSEKAI